MLDKITFKKYMTKLKRYNDYISALNEINKDFGTDTNIVGIDCGIVDHYVEMLTSLMEDEGKFIEWYLYDAPKKSPKVEYPDGKVYIVDNLDILYDVISYDKLIRDDNYTMDDTDVKITYNNDIGCDYELLQDIIIPKGTVLLAGPQSYEYKVSTTDCVVGIGDTDIGFLTISNPDDISILKRK